MHMSCRRRREDLVLIPTEEEEKKKRRREKCQSVRKIFLPRASSQQLLNPLKTTINFHFNGTASVSGMSKWKIKAMNSLSGIYSPISRRDRRRKHTKSKKGGRARGWEKVVATNNHKSFNFLASILTTAEQHKSPSEEERETRKVPRERLGVGTNLYLYHNDSSFGLRVLHLTYNKAHIGCSSDPSAVGRRTSRMNTARDRCTIGMTRGKSCRPAWADRSTAC
jgi:hypothetical protein